MSILVTGGTGFLGHHLLEKLAALDTPVRAIYRSHIPEIPLQNKIEWIKADILDIATLEDAMENVTQVYHCAAKVSFLPKERDELMKINAEGTANVVNLCIEKRISKLLYVSSVAAIGRSRHNEHITEKNKWEDGPDNSGYAFSKHLGEMEVWRGIGEGLNAVIVNPTIILGSGNWKQGSAALFKTVYNRFPFYTTGINGFVDVRDVVKAIVLLMESNISGERFILNGDSWSYQQLFVSMAEAMQVKAPSKKASPWMGEIVWRWEQLKSVLNSGFNPVVTKETARTAQLKVYYDAKKILEYLPGFSFTPLLETIDYYAKIFLQDLQHAG
jgi:nucleoside-diphosphate-sugar epimerase